MALVGGDAPTRMILLAGAGSFEAAHITMTHGVFIGQSDDLAAAVQERLPNIRARKDETVPDSGWAQYRLELAKARAWRALAVTN